MARTHAPDPDNVPTLESLGVELHPDTLKYVENGEALADAIGGNGMRDVFGNPTILMAAGCACLGGLLFGFDQGILSIVLTMKQFLHKFPETDKAATSAASLNKGIMTALLELGAFLGAIMSGFVADRYSRKASIVYGSVWFIIGSVLQAASFHFPTLVIGRFVGGVGIGILSSTAPMYISEIAPPNVRGSFLVLEALSIVFGIVVMFYITYGTRHLSGDWAFRFPFTFQMAPCIGIALLLSRLPYSPRWLAMVGRDRDSLDTLSRLRRLPVESPLVQAEWIQIRAEAIRNRDVAVSAHPDLQGGGTWTEIKLEAAGWVDMFKPGVLRRTMIGVMLMFFQQLTGINALIYYSPMLFESLGLDYEMQITLSGVLNVAQFVAVLIAFLFLDKVGRRPPLIYGAALIAISHFIVAAMIAKYSHNWAAYPTQAWVGVAFLFAFMMFYGVGWAPVPWTMQFAVQGGPLTIPAAEVHSSSRRAKGVAITVCTNWFFNFVIGLITPPMITATGTGTFCFFGAFGVLGGIWAYFFAPETKGKTLEEIDQLFHNNAAHEEMDAKRGIIISICAGAPFQPSWASGVNTPGCDEKDKNAEVWVEQV